MASNMYAGLGASIGVPQSALESVTSLDPKDYVYPNLNRGFPFALDDPLVNKGVQETLQVFSLESACARDRASSLISSQFGYNFTSEHMKFPQSLGLDLADVGDLEGDSLNFLKCDDADKATSEGNSDRSTNTLAAPSRVSPRRNCATSSLKLEQNAKEEEEEEEELLVSAGSCFNGLDTEIISGCCRMLQTGSEERKRCRPLSLSLDYEAAVASINLALETDQVVPGVQSLPKKLRLKSLKSFDSSCESSPSTVKFSFDVRPDGVQV